jgi:1,4-dihydroxy-2-naphthoate octaprenyltransferase
VALPIAAFIRLSRLKFLAGGFTTGALGTAIAAYEGSRIDWGAYALAQATISTYHLMTHYANDYFDRESDALTRRTRFSGGSGVLIDGSLAPRVALVAAWVCLAFGIAGTLGLQFAGLGTAAAFAAVIGPLAWFYSSPPLRLLGRGLGELDTTLVVCVLVPLCTYAAQRGAPDGLVFASTLAPAAAMFAMMIAVEVPDADADAATGKRNLVVLLGRERALPLVVAASTLLVAGIASALASGAPPALGIAGICSLPAALLLALALWRRPDDASRDAAIAFRGVAFFFLTVAFSLAAYLAAAAFRPAPAASPRAVPDMARNAVRLQAVGGGDD